MEPHMTLMDLQIICEMSPKEELLAKLCDWGLIPREGSLLCEKCGNTLRIATDTQAPDGWRWDCGKVTSAQKQNRVKCNFTLPFRKDTFFEISNLDIIQILGFAHFWLKNVSADIIGSELEISPKACEDLAAVCNEVMCFAYLLCPVQLGGPGMVVDIDESKLGLRKYHRGGYLGGQWMFGAYERGTGKVALVAVEARDADLLVPIIQQWILPGTTIVSDIWQTHDCLNNEGYLDLKVNHGVTFIDPEPTARKATKETEWHGAKSTKKIRGPTKAQIRGNLPRCIFSKRCREQKLDRTREFFRLAGIFYDPRYSGEQLESESMAQCKNVQNEHDYADFE